VDKPKQAYERIEEGEYVVFTVSDVGVGISADDIKKIFDPFIPRR